MNQFHAPASLSPVLIRYKIGLRGIYTFKLIKTDHSKKSIIFWDMTPCSPLSVNRRFGGTYRLHLQGRRNKFMGVDGFIVIRTSQWEPSSSLLLTFCFLYKPGFPAGGLSCLPPACLLASCWTYFFDPEDGGDMFLRNVGWHSTDYTTSYPRR
jgi:hypothetical protein